MNETALFRGQVKNTNHWVYGSLIYSANSVFIINDLSDNIIKKHSNGTWQINRPCFLIDNETVGQYTTVDDINGKQLFKDDVVRIPETLHNVEIVGMIVWEKGRFLIKSISSGTTWDISYYIDIEKIGNIHDNPELMNK